MYGIFARTFSINLWNIPAARLTPYGIFVGCFKPLLVFIVKYFRNLSSSSTCEYAFVKSNLENLYPTCTFKNNSSGVGCGYVSFLITGFTVR